MNGLDRLRFVSRIIVFAQLVQHDSRTVMQRHFVVGSFVIIGLDILVGRNEVEVVNRIEMTLDILKALGGTFVVVKRHAGAYHIEYGTSFMMQRALNQRSQLLAVAGETP